MICRLQYATKPSAAEVLADFKTIIMGTLTVVNGRPTNLNADATTSEVLGPTYTNSNSFYVHDDGAPGYYTKTHHLYTGDTNNWFQLSFTGDNLFVRCGDNYADIANNVTTAEDAGVFLLASPTFRVDVVVTDKLVVFCKANSFVGFADIQKNSTNTLAPTTSTCILLNQVPTCTIPTTYDFEADSEVESGRTYLHALNAPPNKLDGYTLKLVLSPVSAGVRKYGFWQVPGLKAVNYPFLSGGIVYDADSNPYWSQGTFLYDGSTVADGIITPGDAYRNSRLIIQG